MERPSVCGSGNLARDEFHSESSLAPPETQAFLISVAAPLELGAAAPVEVEIGPPAPELSTDSGLSWSVRLLDVTVASLLLILVLPLMAVCTVAVIMSSPGPVLFRQRRIGRNGLEFTCLKFRTMVDRADCALEQIFSSNAHSQQEWLAMHKLLCDPRVTPLGRFMRRYSLDELPQLFNVLKGDMSIVGPRPIVAAEIHKYGIHFADYCSVNPGLTGLWQVSGFHALPYSERVRLDAEYARSKSLRLDLIILLKTVPIVVLGGNI